MVDGIHTQTEHILNGQPVDASPVENNLQNIYENCSLFNDAIDALEGQVSGGTLSATNINEFVVGRGVAVDNVLMKDGMVRAISITSTITGSNNGSPVFTTGAAHGLTTGQAIKFNAAPGANIDGGLSQATTYFARSLTSTTFQAHLTAADATNNVNAVAVTTASTGIRWVISRPAASLEGQIWTDGEGSGVHVYQGGQIVDIATSDVYSLLTRFSGTKAPVYVSATQFTVNRIANRDSGGNTTMLKSSSTTVNIATTGLNGIAQSGNLTGTVSVVNGSASVTFSNSQTGVLQAGDILTTAGAQSRKLISVSGTSGVVESQFTTTETAVTFKRGGRASFYTANTSGSVGTAHYFLYVISNGSTTGLILSTRNVAKGETLVDLPSGYIYSQILPFAVTLYNTSTAAGVYVGNLVPFKVGTGWPYRPEIFYDLQITFPGGFGPFQGEANVIYGSQITSVTTVDASMWIPSISRLAFPNMMPYGRPSSYAFKETGTNNFTMACGDFNGGNMWQPRPLPVDASGQFDYQGIVVTGALYLDIIGYIVTEIF